MAQKPFTPKSRLLTTTLSVRLHRELVTEFLEACRRELGPMPFRHGDSARAIVLERLIRAYIETQQPK